MLLRPYFFITLSLAAIACGVAVQFTKPNSQTPAPIPNPTDALQQADRLSIDNLTQLEVDDQIRDRLRVDPEWQAIANAIRQDLIIVKWGSGKLDNPVWKRYGAKAYPLLAYYARSGDETRQIYGISGIRSLGKPYTTIWLEQQIKRRSTKTDFSKITENVSFLLTQTGTSASYESKQWETEFNLNDPATRDRLIKLAQQNLEPQSSPNYYGQFNSEFLVRLLGYEKVYGAYKEPQPISLPKWLEFEKLSQPINPQVKEAIKYFYTLSPEQKSYILVERLAAQKAGEATRFTIDFLQELAQNSNSSALEKIWAILETERHTNVEDSTKQLQTILNGDFKQLSPLTKLVGYESYDQMGAYAYYLLLGLTTKYPQSKFAIACREYGDLTGKSYFGGEPRPKAILEANSKRSNPERIKLWQAWLQKYPEHPGADDATYFLARSYLANNQTTEAVKVWAKMMTTTIGDGDALYLAFPNIRTQLDIGLSPEEIETLLKEPEIQPLATMFKYALAIRMVRSQNYDKALEITTSLDISKMPAQYLASYYNSRIWGSEEKLADIQNQIQKVLTEQRSRWLRLQAWQKTNTAESKYQIASDWSGAEGWKNGYLPLWHGYRTYTLPSLTSTNCQVWYACTSNQIPAATKSNYQISTQNAVALVLYQSLLDDPNTPIREKTLYMFASTLLEQWENHEFSETMEIHTLINPKQMTISSSSDYYQQYQDMEKQIRSDYQSRINAITLELQQKFPNNTYNDDLLFSSYFLSKDRNYLRRLIKEYPNGDRALEAKFLLSQPERSN